MTPSGTLNANACRYHSGNHSVPWLCDHLRTTRISSSANARCYPLARLPVTGRPSVNNGTLSSLPHQPASTTTPGFVRLSPLNNSLPEFHRCAQCRLRWPSSDPTANSEESVISAARRRACRGMTAHKTCSDAYGLQQGRVLRMLLQRRFEPGSFVRQQHLQSVGRTLRRHVSRGWHQASGATTDCCRTGNSRLSFAGHGLLSKLFFQILLLRQQPLLHQKDRAHQSADGEPRQLGHLVIEDPGDMVQLLH